MKCNVCYKVMRLDLKIKNNYGTIEKWICKCGKKSLRTIKGKEVKMEYVR